MNRLTMATGRNPGNAMQMQDQWAHCTKCHTLNYAGLPGLCALGGTHLNSSRNYVLACDTARPATTNPTGADAMVGWRWCSRCQALHYPALYNNCPVPIPQNNVPKNPNVPKTLTFVDPPPGYVYGSAPHVADGAYYNVPPLWGREIA
jgi:hypothetical protein